MALQGNSTAACMLGLLRLDIHLYRLHATTISMLMAWAYVQDHVHMLHMLQHHQLVAHLSTVETHVVARMVGSSIQHDELIGLLFGLQDSTTTRCMATPSMHNEDMLSV